MAIWAVVGGVLKAVGKKALENATSNALSHMGGLGTVLGAAMNAKGDGDNGSSSTNLEDRKVASVGGRDVKLSDTNAPSSSQMGGFNLKQIGNSAMNVAGNLASQNPGSQSQALPMMPSESMPLEDAYGSYKIDDMGGKVLIPSRVDNRQLTKPEAIERYRITNQSLGRFGTDYDAEEFIKKMRNQRNVYGG